MTENSAFPTTLTGQLRCLIDAVRESCGLHGPRGLFALPMALWMWVRSRRMRREIEAAARQFVALAETLVALLEDFRAGRLPPLPPPRGEADQRAGGVDGAGASPGAYPPPSPSPLGGRKYSPRRTRRKAEITDVASTARAASTAHAAGTARAANAPHPPASGPIVAGKNGNPSRAPPSAPSGEGQQFPFFKNRIFPRRRRAGNTFQRENDLSAIGK